MADDVHRPGAVCGDEPQVTRAAEGEDTKSSGAPRDGGAVPARRPARAPGTTEPNHRRVRLTVAAILDDFVRAHGLGAVVMEGGFALMTEPPTLVTPDVAFVTGAEIGEADRQQASLQRPDLVVEVVSEREDLEALRTRVRHYLEAWICAVWVVEPAKRAVIVYEWPRAVRVLRGGDRLTSEDVLPGFQVTVDELFGG